MRFVQEKIDINEPYLKRFEENRELLNRDSSPLFNRMREVAIKRFEKAGIPDFKNEDYKYTNLRQVYGKNYHQQFSANPSDSKLHEAFRCDVPEMETHLILLENGWYYPDQQNLDGLPEGVVIGSIRQIANDQPQLVEEWLNRQAGLSNDANVALNTAFAQDGLFVYIPRNTEIAKPIQVVNLMRSEVDLLTTQRNLIVAGAGSKATLVICDHTLSATSFLYNTVTETFVGENAVLDFYTIQNQHNNTATVNSAFFKLDRHANLMSHTSTLHGGLVRNNLKVSLEGEGAEANVLGMSFTDKSQHVDNFTNIEHIAPHCLSNQVYKNVLDDDSTGAFTGRIHVVRDAQKTNAFQRNNNVLLTNEAKMNTKPQLIIDADDVKCSHGATVGQIDKDALFFLRTRGISEKEARLMLMNAFTYEVIRDIRIEPIRKRIEELVDQRLKGELARCHECAYQCDC